MRCGEQVAITLWQPAGSRHFLHWIVPLGSRPRVLVLYRTQEDG